jgi:RNA polymerase sigma-70 factor (family 1)
VGSGRIFSQNSKFTEVHFRQIEKGGPMIDYKATSDCELIQLLKESDHSAYTEIYLRYFYLLFTHAYKKLRDEEQAKDIIQDLFATLWFKREFDLKTDNVARYLFAAVRNRIFDLFAHEQVKSKHSDSLKNFLNRHLTVPTDHLIRERELNSYIEKAIQALPPKMKQIFELSRKQNLSHKEIAAKLGTSENNISTQITTALRVLRTKLGIIVLVSFLFMSLFIPYYTHYSQVIIHF